MTKVISRSNTSLWRSGYALRGLTLAVSLAAVLAGTVTPARSETTTTKTDTGTLQQMSSSSQALYKKIAPALVRVKLKENLEELITPALRKDFDNWREQGRKDRNFGPGQMPPMGGGPDNFGPAGPIVLRPNLGRRDRERPGANPGDTPSPTTNPTTRPNRGRGGDPRFPGEPMGGGISTTELSRPDSSGAQLFQRFLEQQSQNLNNPEAAQRAKFVLRRLEALRSGQGQEVIGLVYNAEGDTLVLTNLVLEVRRAKVRTALRNVARESRGLDPLPPESTEQPTVVVINSEGKESTAPILGTDLWRGISIIKVDHPLGFVPCATTRPQPGELLALISTHSGASSWITMPATLMPMAGLPSSTGKSATTQTATAALRELMNDRFAISNTDKHGPSFIISTTGQLSALGFAEYAIPVEVLKHELDQLPKEGFIRRAQVGVKWVPVTNQERADNAKLAQRPAVRVDTVLPDSAAQKAGLKAGDYILTVDHHLVARDMFPRIMADLASHSGAIEMGILRGQEEITLTLPLNAALKQPE